MPSCGLGRVNALINLALAGHFPLGGVPWLELEQACRVLAGITSGQDGT